MSARTLIGRTEQRVLRNGHWVRVPFNNPFSNLTINGIKVDMETVRKLASAEVQRFPRTRE